MPSATDKAMLPVSKKTARKRNVDAMSRRSSFDEANNCRMDASPPHGRPSLQIPRLKNKKGAPKAPFDFVSRTPAYLIFVSLNSTCLRATGSYFLNVSLSVLVRAFFEVT